MRLKKLGSSPATLDPSGDYLAALASQLAQLVGVLVLGADCGYAVWTMSEGSPRARCRRRVRKEDASRGAPTRRA